MKAEVAEKRKNTCLDWAAERGTKSAPDKGEHRQTATTELVDQDSENAPSQRSSSSGSAGTGVSYW